jgi:hypothetical protein
MKFSLTTTVTKCNPDSDVSYLYKVYLGNHTSVNPTHFRLTVEMDEDSEGSYTVKAETFIIDENGVEQLNNLSHWPFEEMPEDFKMADVPNLETLVRDLASQYLEDYYQNDELYIQSGIKIDNNFEENLVD